MNLANNLFLIMLNLSQLHDHEKVIKLFTESMNEIFKPASLSFVGNIQNNGYCLEVKTNNSFYGFVHVSNTASLSEEAGILIENAVQMLTVILERLELEARLKREKTSLEKIKNEQFTKLQNLINKLNEKKNVSTTLVEDLNKEVKKRIQYENAMHESEEKFRLLADYTYDWEYWLNPHGNYEYISPSCKRITGYEKEEFLNNPSLMFEIVEDNYRDKVKTHYTTANQETPACEMIFPIVTKNGHRKWLQHYCINIFDSEGNYLGRRGTNRDITEQKNTEEDLVKSEEKFKSIFHKQSAIKFILDPDNGNIFEANKAASDFYGWTMDELKKMNIEQLNAAPEEELKERILKVLSGKQNAFYSKQEKSDGTKVDVELLCSLVEIDNKTYIHTIARDITEQRKLEDQLRQSQKMESIGRLAGGIAHDYNNILTVILNYSELALMKLDPSNEVSNYIQEIKKAGESSHEITNQLLTFARKQSYEPKILDLNDLIKNTFSMLQRLIGENIELEWIAGANLWPVKIDPYQLNQILTNLCINSRDAINGIGKITIKTKNISIHNKFSGKNPHLEVGDFVSLEITDNGCGMDSETVENIFEPFFTTKDKGKGTGLGLSTVYGIIKQNGGFVNVYSEIGKGTTFKIYFKRETREKAKTENAETKAPERGNETLLLVEDETAILRVTKKMLENIGYNVLASESPEKALKIAEEYKGKTIDMIITDVVMPGMNGKELSEKILEIHPDAKVLFMSGYNSNIIVNQGILKEGINFIQKPFNISSLSSKIKNILNSK